MRDSSAEVSASIVAASGRREPAGGIMPARSLRIIFSMTSGCSWAFIALKSASTRPPALPRALWQVAQYLGHELGLRGGRESRPRATATGPGRPHCEPAPEPRAGRRSRGRHRRLALGSRDHESGTGYGGDRDGERERERFHERPRLNRAK